MRRRDLTAGLLLLATSGVPVLAQQLPSKRLALVQATTPAWPPLEDVSDGVYWRIVFADLEKRGYIKGTNLQVERYSAEGHQERYKVIAKEVLESKPDLIVSTGGWAAKAFQEAGTTMPVVSFLSEPVKWGIVESLAHPGGNITGVVSDAGIEIIGKRLQLLKAALPAAHKIAYLGMRAGWEGIWGDTVRTAGAQLSVQVIGMSVNVSTEQEYRRAFEEVISQKPDALLVADAPEFNAYRQLIVHLAEQSRLPAMYSQRFFVDAGGLMAYTADFPEMYHHFAEQVFQLLSGIHAADIPVYQANKYHFVINQRAALSIDFEIPTSVLQLADEVLT